MKTSNFLWAWNDRAPQRDAAMNRARAARLLRSWRRLQRQPANYRPVLSVVRVARGVYRVAHESGETAALIVEREA